MAESINIGGRLHSTATGNIVAGANEILDDTINKKQSEINIETYRLVENINESLENLNPEQTEALSVAEKANSNEVKLGYFECETESNIAAKTITNATGYILSKGGSIKIKMINANTASNVTLNINSTGAKTLYYSGELASLTNTWENNEIIEVYYDGDNYYANNTESGGKFSTGEKVKNVGIDDTPTAGNDNLVKSGGVASINRLRILNNIYPFSLDNEHNRQYAPYIIELYINQEKYQSEDIRLREVRVAQVSTDWGSVPRTSIIISDGASDILRYVSYESTLPTAQFIHNDDYSVCVIMNWKNGESGIGYGYGYSLALERILDSRVKDLDNSPIIKLFLQGESLESVVSANNNKLSLINTDKHEPQYPYLISNTRNLKMATAIKELYIDREKYDSNNIKIRSFRLNQYSSEWGDYLNNVVISDETKDILSYAKHHDTREEAIAEGTSVLLHNNDYSCLAIVDFTALENEGYGTSYQTSVDTIVSDDVFNLNNAPIISFVKKHKEVLDKLDKLVSTNPQFPWSLDVNPVNKICDCVISMYVDKSKIDLTKTYNLVIRNNSERTQVTFYMGLSDLSYYRWLEGEDRPTGRVLLPLYKGRSWESFDTSILYGYIVIDFSLFPSGEDMIWENNSVLSDEVFNDANFPELVALYKSATNIKDIPIATTSKLGVVKIGSNINVNEDGTISSLYPSQATSENEGLMSAADKAKLNGLSFSGTVTINGSGITKNASSFGFLPTNDGTTNATALQSCVDGGGTIIIDLPGTYDLAKSIQLDSNTELLFGENVYIRKVKDDNNIPPRYPFINKGALTKTYNSNIKIKGLYYIQNNIEFTNNNNGDLPYIIGLRGTLAFFYVKNLEIDDFTIVDGLHQPYVIHICTFENIKLTNLHIEGYKDAVHLGNGSKFIIRDCIFKTYDDPIALNADDYTNAQPQYGWIEDGIIENCYDLADPDRGTTGYFARILAGSSVDWYNGMEIHPYGEKVVNNGYLYATNGTRSETPITSTVAPDQDGQFTTSDGITWVRKQPVGSDYTRGVRRVHFKDIFLQKPRGVAFSIHFDNDSWSRSYYPGAVAPIQEDLIFENVFFEAEITNLISAVTPINTIKLINSILQNSKIVLTTLNTQGIVYPKTHILLSGTTFKGSGENTIVSCASGRTADFKVLGSIVESDDFTPSVSNVTVISNDIGL